MTKRVYIDTSVVGGQFDAEFAHLSKPFWDAVIKEEIIIVVSEVLEEELEGAPVIVKNFFRDIPESCIERVISTPEADLLAVRYIAEKVVGKTSYKDCLHIAIATVYRVDALVSWNFKHIVNIGRIRGYHSVNLKWGYPLIEIRNPNEVIDYENDID